MNSISDIINEAIENQGRSRKWVAEQLDDLSYKAFLDRLKKGSFTGVQLIQLGKILNIDLNKIKEEI